MEITFISSLTPDDERRLAAAFLRSMGSMLDFLPIAYSIRIRTTSGKTFTRTHSPAELARTGMPELPEDALPPIDIRMPDQRAPV